MKKKRFSPEQIAAILKEFDNGKTESLESNIKIKIKQVTTNKRGCPFRTTS